MSSQKLWALLLSVGVLLSLSCVSLHAQSTFGSISGTVSDTTGATVANANVTLTNVGTAEKRTQPSGGDGLFTFVDLFPGENRIDVEKHGFKYFARTGLTVDLQRTTHDYSALQAGEVMHVVELRT